ncbi:MAG: hypothetical protein PHX18_07970 [Candidatus Gastranaerophilales bacterium]|nr:hypothetical protein [Candidatus Gastranaerophilales bacterium]
MLSSKFYSFIATLDVDVKKEDEHEKDVDLTKVGLQGVLNFLASTNPNKKYYGLMKQHN